MKKPVKVKILGKGDWITITKGKSCWNSDMNQFVGKTVKIYKKEGTDVTFKNIKGKSGTPGSSSYYWRQMNGHFRAATPVEIENVTRESKPTFKVNDWVVIVNSGSNWTSAMNPFGGRTVQIEKIFAGDCINFKNDGGWTWCFANGHYRKATREEILKTKAPLVTPELLGYKVPVDLYGGRIKKGAIVIADNSGVAYCLNGSYVPKELVETWVKVYKDPVPAFKVGDYIVAKTKCSYLPAGKVAKITRINSDKQVYYSHEAENNDFAIFSEVTDKCRLATKTEIAESLKVVIGGYEAETIRSSVSFRGEKYGKSELESLIKLFEKHPNQIKSLNVGCSGQYKVELSTLKKLQAKLK